MVVGITGNYCSGKDLACSIFQEAGYHVVDVDRIGHRALEVKKTEVVQAFGEDILCNGSIDRKKLGLIIFNCSVEKKKLESIVHPWMIKRVKELVSREENTVINAALLIEMCLFVLCDFVLGIESRRAVMVERAVRRDSITSEEALQKLRSQIPVKEKLQFVDKVIDNNGNLRDFKKEVKTIISYLGLRV